MIRLTDNAVKQLQSLLCDGAEHAGKGLRIFVETGGCAGLQYGMRFDDPMPEDVIAGSDGARVFLDPTSLTHLRGSTLDFDDGLTGGGFKLQNPNAVRSCGCGTSFESAAPTAG